MTDNIKEQPVNDNNKHADILLYSLLVSIIITGIVFIIVYKTGFNLIGIVMLSITGIITTILMLLFARCEHDNHISEQVKKIINDKII